MKYRSSSIPSGVSREQVGNASSTRRKSPFPNLPSRKYAVIPEFVCKRFVNKEDMTSELGVGDYICGSAEVVVFYRNFRITLGLRHLRFNIPINELKLFCGKLSIRGRKVISCAGNEDFGFLRLVRDIDLRMMLILG